MYNIGHRIDLFVELFVYTYMHICIYNRDRESLGVTTVQVSRGHRHSLQSPQLIRFQRREIRRTHLDLSQAETKVKTATSTTTKNINTGLSEKKDVAGFLWKL